MRADIKSEQTQLMQTQFSQQIKMGIQQAFQGMQQQQANNLAPMKMHPQVTNLGPVNLPQQMFTHSQAY